MISLGHKLTDQEGDHWSNGCIVTGLSRGIRPLVLGYGRMLTLHSSECGPSPDTAAFTLLIGTNIS